MFTKRDRHLAAQRRSSARLRERNREIVRKAKSRPCVDCGQKFPTHCMDFDHVPGRGEPKVGNIGSAIAKWASSPELLIAEIKKCDVVCANCHRKRTFSKKRKEETKKVKEAKWGQKRDAKSAPGEQQGAKQPKSGKKTGKRGKALLVWDDSPEDEVPRYQ